MRNSILAFVFIALEAGDNGFASDSIACGQATEPMEFYCYLYKCEYSLAKTVFRDTVVSY